MIPVEIMEVLGVIAAGAGSAFIGGKNSINGIERRINVRFDSMDARMDRLSGKVDVLIKTDGDHESRLGRLEEKK